MMNKQKIILYADQRENIVFSINHASKRFTIKSAYHHNYEQIALIDPNPIIHLRFFSLGSPSQSRPDVTFDYLHMFRTRYSIN